MGCSSPIYEYPVNTWRPDIAQCIIFTMIACGEDAVHKHFRQSVGHCGLPITETVVYSPHFKATRYILMLALDGIRPSEVTITLIAVGRELSVVSSVEVVVVNLCPGSQGQCKQKHCQKEVSLHLLENNLLISRTPLRITFIRKSGIRTLLF